MHCRQVRPSFTSFLLGACASLLLLLLAPPQAEAEPKAEPLRDIAIHANGRPMPLETFAELTLLQYSGRTSYEGRSALEWLAQALFEPSSVFDDAIFLIDNPEAATAARIEPAERGRYSFNALRSGFPRLRSIARQLMDVPEEQRGPADSEIVRLYRNLQHFSRLTATFAFLEPHPDFTISDPNLADSLRLSVGEHSFYEVAQRLGEASQVALPGRPPSQDGSEPSAGASFGLWARMADWAERREPYPFAVVPLFRNGEERWLPPDAALVDPAATERIAAEVSALVRIRSAYRADLPAEVRSAAEEFERSVETRAAETNRRLQTDLEVLYNRLQPFFFAQLLYGSGLVLLVLSLRLRGRWHIRGAQLALGLALFAHTAGLVARVVMTGHPPVTSLYSSFLFVGWAVAAVGLVVGLRGRVRVGALVGLAAGFLLTFLSWGVSAERDTLGVLQAVLNTNFWLSTHVVTITLGYAGCLAAGIVGHVYLVQELLRPYDERRLRESYTLVYWILAIGLVLSFIGTMLGGIWADQSWGRFWGWDPKENGALLIVLWCAILFHARAASIVGQRGMAVGSIIGVLVVMFSWLGVNLMGVGLHSYGFTSGISGILVAIGSAELLFVAAVLVALCLRERRTREQLVRCRVAEKHFHGEEAVTLKLRPTQPIDYEPGMHTSLFVEVDGITYRRPYSFSSAPNASGDFSITAKRVDGGAVSNYLIERAREGERVWVTEPAGELRLRRSGGLSVFVAGGSGIAPFIGMLEQLLSEDPSARAVVLYTNRRERDILFRKFLDRIAAEHRNVHVEYWLEQPPDGWRGGHGVLQAGDIFAAANRRLSSGSGAPISDREENSGDDFYGNETGPVYYICGPEPMVDSLTEGLELEGVDPNRILEERFTPAAHGISGKPIVAGHELRPQIAYIRGRRVTVRAGESLLEAALRAEVPLPYSCAAGRCGECRCKIGVGTVEMLEPNCLTTEERRAGYVLSCVAYPTSEVEVE